MKTVDRLKICPNCDGRIPQEASQCPYCFTTLQVENSKNFAPAQENFLYQDQPKTASKPSYSEKESTAIIEEITTSNFWPILLMTVGGNLLTLGVLQFIFSDHGVVRLEINESYWFLMILVALPLFYFGLKNSKN